MTRPGHVEFIDAHPPAPLDDELTGPRGLPRWVAALAVLVLGAVAVAAVAANAGHAPHRRAAVTSVLPTAPPAVPAAVPGGPAPADALQLPGGTSAVAIAVTGAALYVLQADRISVVNARTHAVERSAPMSGRFVASRDRLIADAAHRRLWIVRAGDGSGVSTVDTTTLTQHAPVPVGPDVARQALLDGRLYLSTSGGVYVTDGATLRRIHRFDTAVPIAADASRHRLLVLESGAVPAIEVLSASGVVSAEVVDDVTGGNLTVVGSTIYLTGAEPGSAVVRVVDPVTLRAGANIDISRQLFPGASVAAAGTHSLWLRSTGRNRDVLWCRDLSGGPLASWWTLPGSVTSEQGAAFVLDSGYVRPVNLFTGCSG